MQEYGLAILRASHGASPYLKGDIYDSPLLIRTKRELKEFNLKKLAQLQPSVIEPCARISFAEAFDIPVDVQLGIEARLRSWQIQVEGCESIELHRDVGTWINTRAYYPEIY